MKKLLEVKMEFHYLYKIEFDPESKEVKTALHDYKNVIEAEGELVDMVKHVIWYYVSNGTQDIEGVGHVTINGQEAHNKQFETSGINLIPVYEEEAEYEITTKIN